MISTGSMSIKSNAVKQMPLGSYRKQKELDSAVALECMRSQTWPSHEASGCNSTPSLLIQWLILISSDVQMKPGPIRYPCGVCRKSVRKKNCIGMHVGAYEALSSPDEQ